MKTDIKEFLKSGAYLPKPLRDFHDQKDVFKTIHATITPENESIKRVNWIDCQCYVIDVFLWFMALRGWTLQRCRIKADFRDLDADIAARREEDAKCFYSIFNAEIAGDSPAD